MPFSTFSFHTQAKVLEQIALTIWGFIEKTNESPEIICSTLGPANDLRIALENSRPKNLHSHLAFLPTIKGVHQWLMETPELAELPPMRPHLERVELVFGLLVNHDYKWIQDSLAISGDAGKWALANAIVHACDLVSSTNVLVDPNYLKFDEALIDTAQKSFDQAMQRAYPNWNNLYVQFEAQLITAFWKSITSIQDEVPRTQLSWFLRTAKYQASGHPVIWLETHPFNGVERGLHQEFLQKAALQNNVLLIQPDWSGIALWSEALEESDLPIVNQIHENRKKIKSEHWRLIGLPSFEKLAWGAMECIREHIDAGRTHIGLIAQDRLVARRVRVLLSRLGSEVSVSDATGWKLSTTGVAASLKSWLTMVRSPMGPNLGTLLGVIKNPAIDCSKFIASKTTSLDPTELMWLIERQVLLNEYSRDWESLMQLFEPRSSTTRWLDVEEAEQWEDYFLLAKYVLSSLRAMVLEWGSRKRTSLEWVNLLSIQLKQLGMYQQMETDVAGRALLKALEELGKLNRVELNANAWFSLLDQWLEESSYQEYPEYRDIKISFITLSSTRLQSFDAIVMLGCDEAHLPSMKNYGMIFSKAMVKALGLPSVDEEYCSQARDLSQMLLAHPYVDLMWQTLQKGGEPNKCSPWITRLKNELPILKDHPIRITQLPVKGEPIAQASAQISTKTLFPSSISPSAYKVLRECPYRFYVTKILKLNSPTALKEDSEYGLIGNTIHEILKQFYDYVKQTPIHEDRAIRKETLLGQLRSISNQIWEIEIDRNGHLLANHQAWMNQLESWIDWQIEQEIDGWQFECAEQSVQKPLLLNTNEIVRLVGRVDRFDLKEGVGAKVIDYKYQTLSSLEGKLKSLVDDPQILMYAIAANHQALVKNQEFVEGEWVSLQSKEPGNRSVKIPITADMLAQFENQIIDDLSKVWSGTPLRASGPDHVCQYCEARGICRKGMWRDD